MARKKSRTQSLTGVNGYRSGPAIRVLDMAATGPVDGEACLFKSADNFSSLDAGKSGHREIC
jgi:hypothetical protein